MSMVLSLAAGMATGLVLSRLLRRVCRWAFVEKGWCRGHEMYEAAPDVWRYVDNDALVSETQNERPCGHCGKPTPESGHDPCIANLPGVVNACCGHGYPGDAFVVFADGQRLSGFLTPDAVGGTE